MVIIVWLLMLATVVSKSLTHLFALIIFILLAKDLMQGKINQSFKQLTRSHQMWSYLFVLSLFWNLLTPGRLFSFLEFLKSGFPLLMIPILLLYFQRRRELSIIIHGFLFAIILGSLVSILNFVIHFPTYAQQDVIRVSSFLVFNRWSSMAMMGLIIAVWKVLISAQRAQYIWIFWSLVIASSLFLTGARGPILWSFVGILALIGMFYFKKFSLNWYKVISIALIFLVMGLSHAKFRDRLISIFSVEIKNGQMVSEHQSNQGRLAMWKVYFDFFKENPIGTGFRNVQTELKPWLADQSSDYKSKYMLGDFSLFSAHNMYIHQMVELGLVASLFLFGLLIFTIYQFFVYFNKINDPLYFLAGSITLANLALGIFYTDFYDYVGFSVFFFIGVIVLFHRGLLQSQSSRFLIFKPGAIGDWLVATAAIRECQSLPGTKALMGPAFLVNLLSPQLWSFLDELWVPSSDKKIYSKYIKSPCHQYWVASDIKLSPFQILLNYSGIINLRYESIRMSTLAFLAGIKIRVGSTHSWASWQFTHSVKWLGYSAPMHERDRNFQVMGGHPLLNQAIYAWKDQFLPVLREIQSETLIKYKLTTKNYILINPTASRREKAWDSKNFRMLVDRLKSMTMFEVKIIGAPNETNWLREVASDPGQMIQPQSLADLYDIVGQAQLLITNVSSMQFMAASTQTPTFVIAGAADLVVWGPLGNQAQFIQASRPQGKSFLKLSKIEKEIVMHQKLSVEDVLKALMEFKLKQKIN